MPKRLTYDYVYNYFKEQGCDLLSKEYKNNYQMLNYICNCGNISNISFNSFQQGHRCMKCSGTPKHSYEYVKNYFEEQGCKLLTKEYINNYQILEYICSCGNKSKISFNNLRNGQRCRKCGNEKIYQSKSFSYEYVYDYFKNCNCKLLSKNYKNSYTMLEFECFCGNISKIRFINFKSSKCCKKCSSKKLSNRFNFSYEYVYNYFKEHDCELLSKEYINSKQFLDYICHCGNISITTFDRFKNSSRCKKCGSDKAAKKLRHSYDFIKNYFELEGCELISTEYKNTNQLLDYKCSCGNISKIRFGDFQRGRRCCLCAESKGEKKINKWLTLNKIVFEPQKIFVGLLGLGNGNLSYDFYLPDYNLLIEFQGIQHKKPIDFSGLGEEYAKKQFKLQKLYDKCKRKYAQNNNINLLEIWYWDFNNIEEVLDQYLNSLEVVI